MKYHLMLCAALALTPTASLASEELADDKILVLACLENLEQGTTWGQCLNLMFQPCVTHEVGSDGHVTCLKDVRIGWRVAMETLQDEVFAAITIGGASELADVMGQWTGYVGQKCQEIGAAKQDTGAESARLGCEITEMAGLSGEFAACLEGRSTAQYCQFEE